MERPSTNQQRADARRRLQHEKPEPRWDLDREYGELQEDLARRLWFNDEDRIRIEVKADRRAAETKQHFVELTSRGLPSGINVTEADFWTIVLPDSVVINVPITKMRRLVAIAEAEGNVVEMNRGSHPTTGALIPLSALVT